MQYTEFHMWIDDIGVEIIAMHYGIGWGERQRVFPQDWWEILWEYSLSFPPSNTIMHCDNFNSDIVYWCTFSYVIKLFHFLVIKTSTWFFSLGNGFIILVVIPTWYRPKASIQFESLTRANSCKNTWKFRVNHVLWLRWFNYESRHFRWRQVPFLCLIQGSIGVSVFCQRKVKKLFFIFNTKLLRNSWERD